MDKLKRYSYIRTTIQSLAALIQNAHFKGFFTGTLYQGSSKNICVPGLNCYSCPGAVGACPIGALQNSLGALRFRFPYYVVGLLLFFGVLLGRLICGFLCPFGFLQELLFKIPFFKKLRTFRGDHLLRKLKYLILILMIVLPLFIKLTPFFCKYLCPSGTVSGILLAIADTRIARLLGALFTWKFMILLALILLSLMIARPFCKYLCPLGAFYGMCNRISLVHYSIDNTQCTQCRTCVSVCDMGIDPVSTPNHSECIRCGKCLKACPSDAIHMDLIKGTQSKKRSCDN